MYSSQNKALDQREYWMYIIIMSLVSRWVAQSYVPIYTPTDELKFYMPCVVTVALWQGCIFIAYMYI